MAKLLTEEEYNALLADRERLEWMACHGAAWNPFLRWLSYDADFCNEAPTMREAIDKARGAKCSN